MNVLSVFMNEHHSITHLSIIRDISSYFVGSDTLNTTLFRFLDIFSDFFWKTIQLDT